MLIYYRLSGFIADRRHDPEHALHDRDPGGVRGVADAARNRRPGVDHRHGGRREHHHLRAHPRGAAPRQVGAHGGRRRVRARLLDRVRRARDQLRGRHRPLLVRVGADPRLRGDACWSASSPTCSPPTGCRTGCSTAWWGAGAPRAPPCRSEDAMPATNAHQKFFEIIKPGSNYEFIGRQKYWIGLSIVLVTLTIIMLPLNAYVFKSRGHMLNWGVDFRGGSEIVARVLQAGRGGRDSQDAGRRRASPTPTWSSTPIRRAASSGTTWSASAPSRSSPSSRPSRSRSRWRTKGAPPSSSFEWSEGGDKVYLRYRQADRPVVAGELAQGDRGQHQPGADASAAPTRTPTR